MGMSAEVVSRLQERATALTQERKRRGRTVPEGLVAPDQIRAFLTLASHPVCMTDMHNLVYLRIILENLKYISSYFDAITMQNNILSFIYIHVQTLILCDFIIRIAYIF